MDSSPFPRNINRTSLQTPLSSRKIFILNGNSDVPLPRILLCIPGPQDYEASRELSRNLFISSGNCFS